MLSQGSIHTAGEKILKKNTDGTTAVSRVTVEGLTEPQVYKRASDRFAPEAMRVSVAAAKINKLLLGDHAVDSTLVVDADSKPVGILSPWVEPHKVPHNDGESPNFTDPTVHKLLLSRVFGKLITAAYCLEDDDSHLENFIKNLASELVRIDTDFSFYPLLTAKEYLLEKENIRLDLNTWEPTDTGFELNDEILAEFPFPVKPELHKHFPTGWAANNDLRLFFINKNKSRPVTPAEQADFIAGIREGFEAFKALELAVVQTVITPVFTGNEALLEEFMTHLSTRIEAVKTANLDMLARNYYTPPEAVLIDGEISHSQPPLPALLADRSISSASTVTNLGSPLPAGSPLPDDRSFMSPPLTAGRVTPPATEHNNAKNSTARMALIMSLNSPKLGPGKAPVCQKPSDGTEPMSYDIAFLSPLL